MERNYGFCGLPASEEIKDTIGLFLFNFISSISYKRSCASSLFSSSHFKPSCLSCLVSQKFSRYWGSDLTLHLSKSFQHYLPISPYITQNSRGWKESKYDEIILKFDLIPFISVRVSINIW